MGYREECAQRLCELIPPEEMQRVMASDAMAEIEPMCLTCLNYEPLASLIPTDWTVVDFGCAYNAQSYLFKNHKRLISVDLSMSAYEPEFHMEIFKPEWCEYVEMSINEWMDKYFHTMNLQQTFAICGYVPAPGETRRVRESFKNVFVYYPG